MRQPTAKVTMKPEAAVEDEASVSVGDGIPGMKAAMGFAGDVFSMWMVGLMTMPMELPSAIGYAQFKQLTGTDWAEAYPQR